MMKTIEDSQIRMLDSIIEAKINKLAMQAFRVLEVKVIQRDEDS